MDPQFILLCIALTNQGLSILLKLNNPSVDINRRITFYFSTIRTMLNADSPPVAPIKYEYLDHTADVQLHTWGDNLTECFEQIAVAMFGYMTEIDTVETVYSYDIEATGDDMPSLLYNYLHEWLYAFSAEPFFIARVVKVLEFDQENFQIKARGWGESFDLQKHPQGTEVKAITYSNMQIHDKADKPELFVIIDI